MTGGACSGYRNRAHRFHLGFHPAKLVYNQCEAEQNNGNANLLSRPEVHHHAVTGSVRIDAEFGEAHPVAFNRGLRDSTSFS
jgi:hypothetical protein